MCSSDIELSVQVVYSGEKSKCWKDAEAIPVSVFISNNLKLSDPSTAKSDENKVPFIICICVYLDLIINITF